MYKFLRIFVILSFPFFLFQCSNSGITLAHKGKSKYKIVVATGADSIIRHAAQELQLHLKEISGVELPVITDSEKESDHEIVIGKTNRFDHESEKTAISDNEGFIISVQNNKLLIAGGGRKGTLYGVYDFLERYMDCRMYAPDALILPKKEKLFVPAVHDIQKPVFTYRETLHLYPIQDQKYADWHKLHNRGDIQRDWGMFVHTYNKLIPPEIYFDRHPEWFSEINGQRIKDGQLCLSNEEMRLELIRNLKKKVEENPEALYWSVSDNDNYNHCTCSKCAELDQSYGNAASGSLIWFINQVAAEFPDKIISTLGYQFSRKAPKNIQPARNVNIMLCSIECNRSLPIAEDPAEEEFRKDVEDWSSLTHNIFLWDYVVQFRNYFNPFPNLHILQPNLQYFADQGIQMIFEQGSNETRTEFHQLRTYLIAKLLWNPYQDTDKIMDDFLDGYYGKAGPYLRKYIDTMKEALLASGKRLGIYQYPVDAAESYLTPELIAKYELLFDQAEEAVKGDRLLSDRVTYARLPLNFAILDLACFDLSDEISLFRKENGKLTVNESIVKRLDQFDADCRYHKVTALEEMHVFTPEVFRNNILKTIEDGKESNFATDKPVTLLTPCSPKYNSKGAAALTDRHFGFLDYRYHWLGFEGNDMEAVVDLIHPEIISSVSVNFLENPLSWIFMPKKVTFFISDDGKKWERKGEVVYHSTEILNDFFIKNFGITFSSQKARYVKAKAESLKTCPAWHRGFGNPCWIFADEIVVR